MTLKVPNIAKHDPNGLCFPAFDLCLGATDLEPPPLSWAISDDYPSRPFPQLFSPHPWCRWYYLTLLGQWPPRSVDFSPVVSTCFGPSKPLRKLTSEAHSPAGLGQVTRDPTMPYIGLPMRGEAVHRSTSYRNWGFVCSWVTCCGHIVTLCSSPFAPVLGLIVTMSGSSPHR